MTRPDIEQAKARMRISFGGGREIKKLPEHLWEGEQVRYMTTGMYGNGTGLIVLTDRRLFFLQDGLMSKKSEDFPLSKVSSVQWSSGMLLGTITVFASGNKAEIKNVNKEDGKEIVDAMRARLAASDAPSTHDPYAPPPSSIAPVPPPASAPAALDVMEQLRKLGELRDAGVLTQEEFDAKKAELLSRL